MKLNQQKNNLLLKRAYLVVAALLVVHLSQAQSTFVPLGSEDYQIADRTEIQSNLISEDVFTNQKPYNRRELVDMIEARDTMRAFYSARDRINHYHLYKNNNEWTVSGQIYSKKPLLKHFYVFKPDFYYVDKGDFLFKANPVFHFSYGSEFETTIPRYINTRGAEFRGLLFNKIGFYSFLSENQIRFPTYIGNSIWQYGAVPKENAFRPSNTNRGVDFFSYDGYLSLPIYDVINFQFGHSKNFIGNGYRSLFLSDNAGPYLFGKLTTKFWKVSYQNIWSEHIQQFPFGSGDSLRDRKYIATHHLSFNATKWLNIGFFETVIQDRTNGIDFNYFNPLIFYKAVEWYLGSPDNVLVGLDWKANFERKFSFYGQVLLDEFRVSELFQNNQGWWANKYGFQAGVKYIDVFDITQLDLQVEYNTVRPYTYAYNNDVLNYTHYNASLAHPLGANFREMIGVLKYKPLKNLYFENRLMIATQGIDTASTNLGANIFSNSNLRPEEYGHETLQGNKTNTLTNDFRVSFSPWFNMFFDVNYTYRRQNDELNIPALNLTTNYLGLSFRANIAYRDLLF